MATLVMKPELNSVRYALYGPDRDCPMAIDRLERLRGSGDDAHSASAVLKRIRGMVRWAGDRDQPSVIAVVGTYGGTAFTKPVIHDTEVDVELHKLVPQAPLHTPVLIELLRATRRVFPGVPVVLLFRTAFSTDLADREALYGLAPDTVAALAVRRFGYQGLYHEAACQHAIRADRRNDREDAPCVVSICLESKPEVACIVAGRPVVMTGGATPLEGLPGETTCGEIDPGIILQLAREPGWGPEQIAEKLTHRSGLLGLVGRPVTLRDIFSERDEGCALAREIVCYRLLQACGAGLAAMGRIDTVVFSGRYASLGNTIGPWLKNRLTFRKARNTHPIRLEIYTDPIDRIAADRAVATVLSAERTAEREKTDLAAADSSPPPCASMTYTRGPGLSRALECGIQKENFRVHTHCRHSEGATRPRDLTGPCDREDLAR